MRRHTLTIYPRERYIDGDYIFSLFKHSQALLVIRETSAGDLDIHRNQPTDKGDHGTF